MARCTGNTAVDRQGLLKIESLAQLDFALGQRVVIRNLGGLCVKSLRIGDFIHDRSFGSFFLGFLCDLLSRAACSQGQSQQSRTTSELREPTTSRESDAVGNESMISRHGVSSLVLS